MLKSQVQSTKAKIASPATDDSQYKERLGNNWAALDPEQRYFKMVTRANMQSTLKEVEEL